MGRHKKKREQKGLRIDVRGNNVEWALKKMKRMVKDSGMILEFASNIGFIISSMSLFIIGYLSQYI